MGLIKNLIYFLSKAGPKTNKNYAYAKFLCKKKKKKKNYGPMQFYLKESSLLYGIHFQYLRKNKLRRKISGNCE